MHQDGYSLGVSPPKINVIRLINTE